MTARSVFGSRRMSFEVNLRPSCRVTSTTVVSRTTWLLVTTTPDGSMRKPEPNPGSTSSNLGRAVAGLPFPSMHTTAGSTRFTTGA